MKYTRSIATRGYTLMEMIIVLFIISLLLGGGVYLMQNVMGDAEIAKAKSDVKTWETNLIRFKTSSLVYPTQQQGLDIMVMEGNGVKNWRQLAKPEALMDPWGHKYQFRNPGKHNPQSYDVFSLGEDGVEGTPDDIGNW